MQKRILTSIVALAMTFSLASCGKTSSGGTAGSLNGPAVSDSSGSAQTVNTAVPDQISFTVDGKHIIFNVSKKIRLETDAWIGICLKGNYVYEEDADENQFTYAFFDEERSDAPDYYFKVSAEDIEDGEYSMVLCNSDNGGYVIASWGLLIKNGMPEVDYSGFRINQKPSDIGETKVPAVEADDDDDYYDETEDDGYGGGEDGDGSDDDDAGGA